MNAIKSLNFPIECTAIYSSVCKKAEEIKNRGLDSSIAVFHDGLEHGLVEEFDYNYSIWPGMDREEGLVIEALADTVHAFLRNQEKPSAGQTFGSAPAAEVDRLWSWLNSLPIKRVNKLRRLHAWFLA